MNKQGMPNMDPRPKRRKTKDNPYTLFTVGLKSLQPHYYVSFRMSNGHAVCLEVEREIFEAMDRFELDDLRYLNEIDNHYERSELTEETLARRAASKSESIESLVLNKLHDETLHEGIKRLPAIQRRRLVLHSFGQFTYTEIAKMENCSVSTVRRSIEAARKKLRAFME